MLLCACARSAVTVDKPGALTNVVMRAGPDKFWVRIDMVEFCDITNALWQGNSVYLPKSLEIFYTHVDGWHIPEIQTCDFTRTFISS